MKAHQRGVNIKMGKIIQKDKEKPALFPWEALYPSILPLPFNPYILAWE